MSDLISRRAVLELVANYDLSMGQVVKGIHELPSVLDDIKAEIEQNIGDNLYKNDGLYLALQIIEKYTLNETKAQ